jgi:uncharacterized protein (TIGR03083 family)
VDTTTYLRHLGTDGRALASVVVRDPSARVPTCPDWSLADLLAHVGSAHDWAEETVRTRATDFCPFAKPPKDFEAVRSWYDEGVDQLLETLREVDPDEPVWNWLVMGAGPARFWQRRMAHETAVHRWDAENALSSGSPIDKDLAVDGIDEYLSIANFSLSMKPNEALTGGLGLDALDAPLSSTLTLTPAAIDQQEGLEGADTVVRGSSSDLLLWLTGRRNVDEEGVSVEGDRSVIDAWATVRF